MPPGGPARLTCTKHAAGRLCRWTGRKSSCSARSKSGISASSGCGSPTCSDTSSRSRSRPPSSRARSPRASASTARPSRASPGSTRRTCSPSPTRRRSSCMPVGGESAGTGRMFCDILLPDGSPSLRRPAVRAQARARPARPARLHLLHPPRDRVLPAPGAARSPGAEPQPIDTGGYFDHTPHGIAHDFRREAITMLEGAGHLGRVQPPRGRPRPAGDRPALRRRADHRRQHHDVPAGHEGGRARAGGLRLVHAQAVHRVPRLGHAHPHVAVRGRPQRLPRAGRGVPALQGRPGVHRRAAPARGRDHRGLQPVGQLLQAAVGRHRADRRRRRRGPGLRLLGPQQPLGADPGADVQAAEGQRDPDRVPLHRPGLQPLPGLRGHPGAPG